MRWLNWFRFVCHVLESIASIPLCADPSWGHGGLPPSGGCACKKNTCRSLGNTSFIHLTGGVPKSSPHWLRPSSESRLKLVAV